MRKLLGGVAALLALHLVFANVCQGQNPPKKQPPVKQEDPTPEDYAQLRKLKEVYGTITYVDLGTGKLTLKIEIKKQVPNNTPQNTRSMNAQQQALMRAQQQIMRDYQSIMTSRNPVQQQQRMQKLMMDYQNLQMRMVQAGMSQANAFKIVTTAKDFDFDVSDKLRVSRMELPQEYDDKGNSVTYSKEELKKKQDSVLPGYTAKPDEVQPGQKVKLVLGARKATPKKKSDGDKLDAPVEKVEPKVAPVDPNPDSKTTKSTTTDKTGTATKDPPPPPYILAVVIYREPDASTQTSEKKKKKKKDNN